MDISAAEVVLLAAAGREARLSSAKTGKCEWLESLFEPQNELGLSENRLNP